MGINAPQNWDARNQSGNRKLQTHSGRAMVGAASSGACCYQLSTRIRAARNPPPKPSCIRTTKGP